MYLLQKVFGQCTGLSKKYQPTFQKNEQKKIPLQRIEKAFKIGNVV